MLRSKCWVLQRRFQVRAMLLHSVHGIVDNERQKGVKLVRRGIPVATSGISEHRNALKLALITAEWIDGERE